MHAYVSMYLLSGLTCVISMSENQHKNKKKEGESPFFFAISHFFFADVIFCASSERMKVLFLATFIERSQRTEAALTLHR